jgi:hypothetical protein
MLALPTLCGLIMQTGTVELPEEPCRTDTLRGDEDLIIEKVGETPIILCGMCATVVEHSDVINSVSDETVISAPSVTTADDTDGPVKLIVVEICGGS